MTERSQVEMADQDLLVSRLAQAVKEFGESRPLTWRACHAFRDVVGADGSSITFENSSMARVTICATDQSAELLENLQDVLQEGPCQAAFKSGTPTRTGVDREAATRWPQFIPAAEKAVGPDAVLWTIPMRSQGVVMGVISLYRRLPGLLAVTAGEAQVLADAVGDMLVEDPMADATVSQLAEGGWSSRSVVHLAAGMVAGQLGISARDALAVLRSYAFASDAQLREVARDIVERRLDLSAS
jgi:hypothetical protein